MASPASFSCGEVLAGPFTGHEPVRVRGRLVAIIDEQWVLADASARVTVRLGPDDNRAPPPPLGSWLLLCGVPAAGEVVDATLLDVAPGTFKTDGDFARITGIANNLRSLARARKLVREYFDTRAFVEVSTPTRVASPGTDPFIAPYRSDDEWLITSPEFHMKRLLVGGMDRIYQLTQCHRREEWGAWHQPEFLLLEWYRAFEGVEAVMDDTEALVRSLFEALAGAPRLQSGGRTVELSAPFMRMTVRDAFAQYAQCRDVVDLAANDERTYFELLVDRVEPALARVSQPVFLTEYPATQAALARKKPDDARVAERFELYLAGVELCNGYGELTDPVEQRDRFERDQALRTQRGLESIPADEQFLEALSEGLPPCSGNALGFERLVALTLGVPLRDVLAFPR